MIEMQERSIVETVRDILSRTGIPFAVDAWENEAPADYGVVELTGEDKGEWADGHMIDQSFVLLVTIYVSGGSQRWKDRIQRQLARIETGYTLKDHRYLDDIDKNMWQWKVTVYDPIEWDEAVETDG